MPSPDYAPLSPLYNPETNKDLNIQIQQNSSVEMPSPDYAPLSPLYNQETSQTTVPLKTLAPIENESILDVETEKKTENLDKESKENDENNKGNESKKIVLTDDVNKDENEK